MRYGDIYPREQASRALEVFFREGNLTALRELVLRRVAEQVEHQLDDYMHEHSLEAGRPADSAGGIAGFRRTGLVDAMMRAHPHLNIHLVARTDEP